MTMLTQPVRNIVVIALCICLIIISVSFNIHILSPVVYIARNETFAVQCKSTEFETFTNNYNTTLVITNNISLFISWIYALPLKVKPIGFTHIMSLMCMILCTCINIYYLLHFKSVALCITQLWYTLQSLSQCFAVLSIIGVSYNIYYKQYLHVRLWILCYIVILILPPVHFISLHTMHKYIPKYNIVPLDYVTIAAIYPSLILLYILSFFNCCYLDINILNKRNLIQWTKSLTAWNPLIFKYIIPWSNITALQWILLFVWEDIRIEYLGIVVINIWCITGVFSSFIHLSIRNGTFNKFNEKYTSIMPLLLTLCVLISLQIFWRAYNHPYLFQIILNPSYLYIECTYWYWICKAIILLIESIGCIYYYFIYLNSKHIKYKYEEDRLMEWTLRLNHTCSTFTYLMATYFICVYFGIVNDKEIETCWQTIFIIESIIKFVLPLIWNIYDTHCDIIVPFRKR
eukprot:215411_1